MSEKIAQGQCLCGVVKVSFPFENDHFDACHCGMCRKWGGGPAMTVHGGTTPTFTGAESIAVYNSSDWAERGFCKHCGTHLFYRLKQAKMHFIPVGILEKSDHLQFHVQIFVDKKPKNYDFANKTEMMTEAQVFAKHTGN